LLALPIVGMFYGRTTGPRADRRRGRCEFHARCDTALESPLGQIASIPMLA